MHLCLVFSILALVALACGAASAERVTLSREQLLDKVRGGWAGQVIGVVVGGPTEFKACGKMYEEPIAWDAMAMKDAINQDDLYVEMTFARVLEQQGLDAPAEAFGKAFADSQYKLWHANLVGRKNAQAGLMPPDSGHPKHNLHADDIDFQIEADFIGLMCPGMPATSNEYCDRIGHVMNYGDGVYGGMFITAMYATAYFENDVRKVVEAGLAAVPSESEFYKALRDAVRFHDAHPDDLAAAWRDFENTWANTDACPFGALNTFDIDAKTNSAYVALGLLYGAGDLVKTTDAAIRCGQDSDCNAASAAGVIGTIMGYNALPADWRGELEKIQNEKFSYTDYSFRDVCESTMERAEALIVRGGGSVEGDAIAVEIQAPVPAKLEQWKQDKPVARVTYKDPAFTTKGKWRDEKAERFSDEKGAVLTFTFEGTGVMLTGPFGSGYGIVDVAVDGKPEMRVDLFLRPEGEDGSLRRGEGLFQIMGLDRGKHIVTLTVTGEKNPEATGITVGVQDAIVFDGPEEAKG
jgi:hypothetical protein